MRCSTQRTDGTPSRLCRRVCGAGQPRGGSFAQIVAGGRGAGVGGGVRPIGAAGATVCQRGTRAARWCAGTGAHRGIHRQVGAVADRGAAPPGGSDWSDAERGDCRGGACVTVLAGGAVARRLEVEFSSDRLAAARQARAYSVLAPERRRVIGSEGAVMSGSVRLSSGQSRNAAATRGCPPSASVKSRRSPARPPRCVSWLARRYAYRGAAA